MHGRRIEICDLISVVRWCEN